MSESPQPAAAGPHVGPGARRPRYQRSTGGLLGALIVSVVAVLAIAGLRALTSDPEPTPVRAVDYSAMMRAGRADAKLLVLAPERLPAGWTATSATYTTGGSPTWHLGMLTDQRKYVGVEESGASVRSLVTEHVDVNAERGADVTIAGETWQVWTDSGGDYAVVRTLPGPKGQSETVVVVGSAPETAIREFAATLHE